MLQARPGGREQWAAVRRRPPHSWVPWWSPAAHRLRAGGRSPRTRGAAWGARRLGQHEPGLAVPGNPAAGARPGARIVRPSERRAHCATGGGGRAGAHLPSATLIGMLPEQLRPGRMTPTSRQRPPPGRSRPGFPSPDLRLGWGGDSAGTLGKLDSAFCTQSQA